MWTIAPFSVAELQGTSGASSSVLSAGFPSMNMVFKMCCTMLMTHSMWSLQACFLQILDNIGLLHEDEDAKQLHGEKLEIISFEVDSPNMMICIPPESKQKLANHIHNSILHPPTPQQQPTKAWLCTLGYTNWALNAFPLLKPTLNSSYDKVAGHTFMNAPLYSKKILIYSGLQTK